MAQIVINEISQNYTYNIGTNSFATVAMPITACWGPGFFDWGSLEESQLEDVVWQRFPATQRGLEAFVATYRGPAANYRLAKDYSYQMAMTLLTAGYDVLVCRLCPGSYSEGDFAMTTTSGGDSDSKLFHVSAKYPGTFGDSIKVKMMKRTYRTPKREKKTYWNIIVYSFDASGIGTAVENLTFVFDVANSDDNLIHISEVESNFLEFSNYSGITDEYEIQAEDSTQEVIELTGGSDRFAPDDPRTADTFTEARFAGVEMNTGTTYSDYLNAVQTPEIDADIVKYKEWLYTVLVGTEQFSGVYSLLKDKLTYNPNRIISPGWDDVDICELIDDPEPKASFSLISPIHVRLMDVAYYSRCATSLIDVPRSLSRAGVYDESMENPGYAQRLSRYNSELTLDVNGTLYPSHSALFAPWGQYTYVGTSKNNTASPSFLALMIQRAQILNQAAQYEWALPTNRKHNLRIGKLAYNVPKKVLDEWQKLEGVGVNIICPIPDLGTNLWGNSTLFEVPPATYQALANLSTRYLVNAVEDVAYRVGINITFQYNNDQAYNKFYAGVTPILDTMKNIGAIDDYYVKMSADINGLDQVNANTVIGKIYLVINGVINDIYIDLIALPPGTDLNLYRS